jgi:hypothetical protein
MPLSISRNSRILVLLRFDVNDGAADTIFFRINNSTDLASLMVHIHAWRPDEFTRQDNENWFRLWWD